MWRRLPRCQEFLVRTKIAEALADAHDNPFKGYDNDDCRYDFFAGDASALDGAEFADKPRLVHCPDLVQDELSLFVLENAGNAAWIVSFLGVMEATITVRMWSFISSGEIITHRAAGEGLDQQLRPR
jgi:hypothetical protein